MTTEKKSAIIYADWIEQFESLNDEEAGKLVKHIMRYINDLNPQAPDRMTDLLFIPIKQCIERDAIKWEKRAEKSRANGSKGGRPQNNLNNPVGFSETKETQKVFLLPTEPDNGNVNVNVNVNGNGNVNVNDNDNGNENDKEYINSCIETLYKIYPTHCLLRNTATGKGNKNKIQLGKLLAKNTFEELHEIFNLYLEDCKIGKKYLKDFTTFLNNLPNVDSFKKEIGNGQASASKQNMSMSHELICMQDNEHKRPNVYEAERNLYYSECLRLGLEPWDYDTEKPIDLSKPILYINWI